LIVGTRRWFSVRVSVIIYASLFTVQVDTKNILENKQQEKNPKNTYLTSN